MESLYQTERRIGAASPTRLKIIDPHEVTEWGKSGPAQSEGVANVSHAGGTRDSL